MLHLIFSIWYFQFLSSYLKVTCLVTLFDRKLQGLKKSPKLIIFGNFNELLSIQNVNVARFARNVECISLTLWDFSWPFSKVTLTIFTSVLVFLLPFFLLFALGGSSDRGFVASLSQVPDSCCIRERIGCGKTAFEDDNSGTIR